MCQQKDNNQESVCFLIYNSQLLRLGIARSVSLYEECVLEVSPVSRAASLHLNGDLIRSPQY